MAISRILGASLVSDLDRQGVDLQFSTSGNSLVYMDFVDFRLGVNETNPSEALHVNGNILVANGNVLTSANLVYNLGSETNWWNTLYIGNIVAGSFTAGNVDGVLSTSSQPNITSLGTLTGLAIDGNLSVNVAILPFADNTGTIGTELLTWSSLHASTVNASSIYGTILTADQPNITNLGNITVDSISIGGNITITGNTNGGIINADELYEANNRVLTSNTTFTVTGDATGSGNSTNIALTLADTGVTAGIYGSADDEFADRIPKITVDSKGRITNIANVTLTQVGNVSFNDTTISANADMTVTSTGNIYLDAQGAGIVRISGSDALGLPSGDSGNRPINPETGYFRFNSDIGGVEYWDGTDWISPGIQPISSQVLTPDGVTDDFVLSDDATPESVLVMINGTLQQPYVAYTVTGNVITFSEVPLTSDVIEVRRIAAGATTVAGLALGATTVGLTAGNVNIAGNLIPAADVTYDIGSSSKQWRDLFLSGNTIHLGGATLSTDGSTLEFTPAGGSAINLSGDTDNIIANTITTNSLTLSNINIALGFQAGQTDQGSTAVAVGYGAGLTTQGEEAVAVGPNSGGTAQSNGAVAVGASAGSNSQGLDAVAVGNNAGNETQSIRAVAVGRRAGYTGQGGSAIAIGSTAGQTNQSSGAVSVGADSGQTNQGSYSVALGFRAGYLNQANNTIIINATGSSTNGVADQSNSFYVNPIRNALGNVGILQYNNATKEVTYHTDITVGTITSNTVTLTNALAITSGGTGATTATDALNNLLPSGEQTGYVLTTGGAGTYYWATAGGGGGATVGQTLTTLRQSNVATEGQTVFDLVNDLDYTPGTGQLRVYIDGTRQFPSAYTETSNVSFTLSAGVSAGTEVFAEIDAFSTFENFANLTYASNIGNIAAAGLTVQNAIDTLETSKAPLASPVFTGTVTIENPLAVTEGGTGAATAAGALNNLLPSGEQTGYVLKTSGPGTYYWSGESGGGGATVGQELTTLRQANVISGNTTVINLNGIDYTPGSGQLRVYVNGVRQFPSAYTETSNVSYTLSANVTTGDTVFTEIDSFGTFENFANLTYASNVGNIQASGLTVQSAIEDLETNKAPLTDPVFSSSVTINGQTNLQQISETLNTKTGATGTVVHDYSTGAIWWHSSVSSNFTANITNVPTTDNRVLSVAIAINQGATGYYPNAVQIDGAAQTIRWQGNTAPTPGVNRVDIYSYNLIRTGTTWYVLGSATSH